MIEMNHDRMIQEEVKNSITIAQILYVLAESATPITTENLKRYFGASEETMIDIVKELIKDSWPIFFDCNGFLVIEKKFIDEPILIAMILMERGEISQKEAEELMKEAKTSIVIWTNGLN